MRSNRALLQINRTFLVCFVGSALTTVAATELFSEYENHIRTTLVIALGYVAFFGIFSSFFYLDNKRRYRAMERGAIKRELLATISSLAVGEIVYLAVKWLALYYLLEAGLESYIAALASETISAGVYVVVVTVLLRKTDTF